MLHADRDDPPSNWSPFPAVRLADDIYYGWPDGEAKPWIYHWCAAAGCWRCAGSGQHDLISREPLHLEPSLYWPECCGLHGWVRQGSWQDV